MSVQAGSFGAAGRRNDERTYGLNAVTRMGVHVMAACMLHVARASESASSPEHRQMARVSRKRMYEALDATAGQNAWFSRADTYGDTGVLEAVGFPVETVEEVPVMLAQHWRPDGQRFRSGCTSNHTQKRTT